MAKDGSKRHHSRESLYSPRRLEAVKKQQKALELRCAGRNWYEIAEALGYKGHTGAILAVQSALKKTLTPPANEFRAMTLERLTVIARTFWPKMLNGDEKAANICFRALDSIRALLGLDAPARVQIDLRTEVQKIAQEQGLNVEEVLKEAEIIFANKR